MPAVGQFGDLDYRRISLFDPVQPSNAGIEHPRIDVVRNFLRADQQPFQLGIVNMGHIRPVVEGNPIASLMKQSQGTLLQTAGRQP